MNISHSIKISHIRVIFLSILCFIFCVSCHKEKEIETAIATIQTNVKHLYFKGTILPIRGIPIVSPFDATIKNIYFQYGQKVQKNQILFKIEATQLKTDLKNSLSDWLQKKSNMQLQKLKYAGDVTLYKSGVLSRQDYRSSQNNYAISVLSLEQTRLILHHILKQLNRDTKNIESMRLSDTPAVKKFLNESIEDTVLRATQDGIILFPDTEHTAPAESNEHSTPSVWIPGSSVKENQILCFLGDTTGLKLQISVGEQDIASIHKGLPVVISSDAFPNQLNGFVRYVAFQSHERSQGSDEEHEFLASIEVPRVEPDAWTMMRVGMNAKVDIQIKKEPALFIPLEAIELIHGAPFVSRMNQKTKQWTRISVETGETVGSNISILRGLSPGDQVLLHRTEW